MEGVRKIVEDKRTIWYVDMKRMSTEKAKAYMEEVKEYIKGKLK